MLSCIAWRPGDEDSIQETLVSEAEPALFEILHDVAHAVLNNSGKSIYSVF